MKLESFESGMLSSSDARRLFLCPSNTGPLGPFPTHQPQIYNTFSRLTTADLALWYDYAVFRSSKWSMTTNHLRARSIFPHLRDSWWPICSSRVKVGRCGKLMAFTEPPFHRFCVCYISPHFPFTRDTPGCLARIARHSRAYELQC